MIRGTDLCFGFAFFKINEKQSGVHLKKLEDMQAQQFKKLEDTPTQQFTQLVIHLPQFQWLQLNP